MYQQVIHIAHWPARLTGQAVAPRVLTENGRLSHAVSAKSFTFWG
jgi:hypothetical protein